MNIDKNRKPPTLHYDVWCSECGIQLLATFKELHFDRCDDCEDREAQQEASHDR